MTKTRLFHNAFWNVWGLIDIVWLVLQIMFPNPFLNLILFTWFLIGASLLFIQITTTHHFPS